MLTQLEFERAFTPSMRDVRATATNVVDVWPYVQTIPASDLEGHDIWYEFVEAVYRTGDSHFDHVLVMTKTKNVYVVVVIDLLNECVYGHRVLNLNREYGIERC